MRKNTDEHGNTILGNYITQIRFCTKHNFRTPRRGLDVQAGGLFFDAIFLSVLLLMESMAVAK